MTCISLIYVLRREESKAKREMAKTTPLLAEFAPAKALRSPKMHPNDDYLGGE
jgi:hypothetical protein